jgi:hypothetical protein
MDATAAPDDVLLLLLSLTPGQMHSSACML